MTGFLFDQNPPRVPSLQTSLPIKHVSELGPRPTDSEVWAHAQRNDLAIVTKDADFSQRIVLAAPPPRVVHLRVGNMRRSDFAAWLERVWPRIESAVRYAQTSQCLPRSHGGREIASRPHSQPKKDFTTDAAEPGAQ
jgi:predicted nuclease of predicted toxin-antitoxin system